MIAKAKYLGSLILPSPLELEITLSVYRDRIEIPELEAKVYLEKIDKIRRVKGSELPAETTIMAGVVGLIIDKNKQYVVIEIKSDTSDIPTAIIQQQSKSSFSMDGILLEFANDAVADELVKEIESKRSHS